MSYKYTYNKTLLSYAKSNRKEDNDAEHHLWYYLRNRRLGGYKFRRQFPVNNYILDFYCSEKKIAIELDGSQHTEHEFYDKRRDDQLKKLGITILRFWDIDVFRNIAGVLEQVVIILEAVPAPEPHLFEPEPQSRRPNPLLKGEGKIQKL